MPPFSKPNAIVRTKPIGIRHLPLVLVPGVALLPLFLSRLGLLGFPTFWAGFLLVSLAILYVRSHVWRSRRADVRVEREVLVIAGDHVLARDSVRKIRVARSRERVVVRFEPYWLWRPIEVVVDSEEEGAALIGAMRLDARRTVVSYGFIHGTFRRFLAKMTAIACSVVVELGLLFFCPTLADSTAALVVLFPFLVLACVYLAGRPFAIRISVGADGLRIRRDFGRERFIPYADVDSIEPGKATHTIRIRGRAPVVFPVDGLAHWAVPFRGRQLKQADAGGEETAFLQRVEENLIAHRGRNPSNLAALARSTRPTKIWLGDLERLRDQHAGYRVPAIPLEHLWRVVEDATARPSERAAAALLLRECLVRGDRERLRSAAEACAAPSLRVALEAAATENDAALAEALDSVEDDEGRADKGM